MSAEQESRQAATNPSGDIARAVHARARWVQWAVSPWTRRWLGETGGPARADRHFGTALTAQNTHRFLNRVQRLADPGSARRPEAGALEPAPAERFAGALVKRFPDVGVRYEVQSPEASEADASDLVLVGAGEAPPSEPEERDWMASLPSFAELQQAMQAARPSQMPAASQPASPQLQREATPRPPDRPIPRTPPPGERVFSRVEEVTPGGQTPAPAQREAASDRAQAEEVSAVPEQEAPSGFEEQLTTVPDHPQPALEPRPPMEPPPVQRRIDRDVPVPPVAPGPEPEPPSAQVEAPRPSTEREVLPREAVGRPEMSAPTPPLEEQTPTPETAPLSAPPRPPMEPGLPPVQASVPPLQRRPEEGLTALEEVTAPASTDEGPELPLVRAEAPPVQRRSPVPEPPTFVEPELPPVQASVPSLQRRPEEGLTVLEEVTAPASTDEGPEPPSARVEGPPPSAEAEEAAVQRQVETETPLPEDALALGPPRPSVARELPLTRPVLPRPPVQREVPPMEAEAPLVKRGAGEEMPPQAETPVPEPTAAQVEAEAPPVQRQPDQDAATAGLDQTILARAASRARMPLSEPLSGDRFEQKWGRAEAPEAPVEPGPLSLPQAEVIQTRPLERTAILPQTRAQAKLEGKEGRPASGPVAEAEPATHRPAAYTPPGPLPKPPVGLPRRESVPEAEPSTASLGQSPDSGDRLPLVSGWPISARMVQRQAVEAYPGPAVTPGEVRVVQRAGEKPPETSTAEEPGPESNLEDLARQIFSLIKRKLAVERERERRQGRY